MSQRSIPNSDVGDIGTAFRVLGLGHPVFCMNFQLKVMGGCYLLQDCHSRHCKVCTQGRGNHPWDQYHPRANLPPPFRAELCPLYLSVILQVAAGGMSLTVGVKDAGKIPEISLLAMQFDRISLITRHVRRKTATTFSLLVGR